MKKNFELTWKHFIIIGVILIGIISLFKSYNNVKPGERGFAYRPYSNGVDTVKTYSEGVEFCLPWNELLKYDVRQKSIDMQISVLEKAGLEVIIDLTVISNPMKDKIGLLHTKTGRGYSDILIKPHTRSTVREVIGQFSAEELYSTKREALQTKCEEILFEKFSGDYIQLQDILIRDVTLPTVIKQAIESKQKQEQDNLLAKKLEQEAKFKKLAKIEIAKGDSASIVINAHGDAEKIRVMQKQLSKSPEYTNYLKWKLFGEAKMSPYGNNNVFGANTAVLKGLK